MKIKVPLALLLLLATGFGYLLGTEAGREKRDVILVKVGRKEAAPADGDTTVAETEAAEAADAD